MKSAVPKLNGSRVAPVSMRRPISTIACCAAALLIAMPGVAAAQTFQVTTESDSNSGTCLSGSCTLRQAVGAVDSGAGGDVIDVPAGVYSLSFGQLVLDKDVTIVGAGESVTTIDGGGLGRVFEVPSSAVTVHLEGLAVEGGRVLSTGTVEAHGGGILNAGTLSLTDVAVRGNTVVGANGATLIPAGGGIFNSGTLDLLDGTVADNHATTLPFAGGIPEGGGIFNEGGEVDLTDSLVSSNVVENSEGIPTGGGLASIASSAHGATVELTRVRVEDNQIVGEGGIGEAGGIFAFRTDLTVRESAVTGNRVSGPTLIDGGGIYLLREGNLVVERSLVADNVIEGGTGTDGAGLVVNGETTELQRIVDSTITGNRGSAAEYNDGEGIFHFGGPTLKVLGSTISGNASPAADPDSQGGDLWDSGAEHSALVLRDSIVSGGSAAPGSENCSGAGVQSEGHNIDSLDQCNFHVAGDKVDTDPLLVPLADNGGPTETEALTAGSPAIDAGDSACPPTDQRGVPRPQGSACDIGAFELVPPSMTSAGGNPAAATGAGGAAGLQILSKTVRINPRTRRGTLRARCLNVAGDRCQVVLSLSGRARAAGGKEKAHRGKGIRSVRLGGVDGTIAGGAAGGLPVTLTKRGLALLETRPHGLAATAVGGSRNGAGQATAIRRRLTLEGKPARRH